MNKTAVFTIASENYFAQVQTLLRSLKETNPSWDRYFAVVDEPDDDLKNALKKTNTTLIRMEEIGIPDLNDMKFRYDIMELNTAIKPFVILKLMEKYERVVYLDPDICVYHEMTEVNDAFDNGYEFVLTPHFTDYFAEDGFHPDEPDIMRAGIYNFGFFAVKACEDGKKAVSWWARKLEKQCINKQKEGIFVDQKWMDLLIGRHDKVYVIRNNGYNTAYWNLSHRKATYSDDYYFNGDRLVFFHFSGFNPFMPDEISKHQTRYAMDDIGVAKELFSAYAKEAIEDNDMAEWRKKEYSYNNFSDGRKIQNIFRILYRDYPDVYQLLRGRNPFECSDIFYDNKKQLMPYLISKVFYGREDVAEFMLNTKRQAWVNIFATILKNEYKMDEDWIGYATAYFAKHLKNFDGDKILISLKKNTRQEDGINLIGYIKSEHGVGEACRLTANALSNTYMRWNIFDWEMGNPSRQTDNTWDEKIKSDIKYDISIFNINADQMPVAKKHLPKEAFNGYRIGIWYWELTEFPEEWQSSFDLVDEIWAPTRFIKENLEKVSTVPVKYMPPGIEKKAYDPKYNRDYFDLPNDAFLFLNYFDALSYTSRKNPEAAIKAFQKTFKPDDMSVGLVLKINNPQNAEDSIKQINEIIGDYKNIYTMAKVLSRDEMDGLLNVVDVAVSLHRSEGLGLLCEEAMFYGKPVIATNWSGNTDFMEEDCSCLVDYEMVPVGEYYGDNTKKQYWAEADVDQASSYMEKLYSNKEYYNEIATNAKRHIREYFSPEKCGARMQRRLDEILEDKPMWIDRIEDNEARYNPGFFAQKITTFHILRTRYGMKGLMRLIIDKYFRHK